MRNRTILTAAALTLTLAASAVKPTKITKDGDIEICPIEFGSKGKPSFFFFGGDENSRTFDQLSEDMEVINTFSLPIKTIPQKLKS